MQIKAQKSRVKGSVAKSFKSERWVEQSGDPVWTL